jgi:hypothetical protein
MPQKTLQNEIVFFKCFFERHFLYKESYPAPALEGTVVERPKPNAAAETRTRLTNVIAPDDSEDFINTSEIPRIGGVGETPKNPVRLDFSPGTDYSNARVQIIEYCNEKYPEDTPGKWRQSRRYKGIEVQTMKSPNGSVYSLYFDISSIISPTISQDRSSK